MTRGQIIREDQRMPDIGNMLKDLKADLKVALGNKLSEIILFGSYSRGDFNEYSDIDLLIIINGILDKNEQQNVDDLVADYSLENEVVISGLLYPAEIYHKFNSPFLQNVKEEGVTI
jgi:predicted nucleotidyltransferase